MTQITTLGEYQEPDLLRCKVRQALGSITMSKASGGNGIPDELFHILKDDAVKVLHSIYSKFGNLSSHKAGKSQFSFQSQRKAIIMFKLPHNCTHLTHQQSNAQNSPSQASTVNELWTYRWKFKLDLEKAEEPEIKLPTSAGSQKKHESSRKTSTSALLIMPSL